MVSPLVYEEGHLDLEAGFQDGGLGATGGGVALEARVGVLHLQVHGDRQVNADRRVLVGEQFTTMFSFR